MVEGDEIIGQKHMLIRPLLHDSNIPILPLFFLTKGV
jgi:hypothetical protein